MATTRRKPTRRRTKAKSSPRSSGRSFGVLLFGVVLGLALAAFLSYYLKTSPVPVITQAPSVSPPPSQSVESRPSSPPSVASQTIPSTSTATLSSDPLAPVLDPNTGLVNTPPSTSSSIINPNALIKPKDNREENQLSIASTDSSSATVAPNSRLSSTKAKPQKPVDPIAQLIETMPEGKSAPVISANVPKTPLQIEAPHTVTATDKGSLLTSPATKASPRYLQVGSFALQQEADATRARMLMLGFANVSISKIKINNAEFNRVRIGPFNDEQTLKFSQEKLQSANIKASVVR